MDARSKFVVAQAVALMAGSDAYKVKTLDEVTNEILGTLDAVTEFFDKADTEGTVH